MKAFASLHTEFPNSQLESEVSYPGYHRVPVEFDGDIQNFSANLIFPTIEEDSADVVRCVAIGSAECSQGEIFMRIPILPHINILALNDRRTEEFWRQEGIPEEQIQSCIENYGCAQPKIAVCNNEPIFLPETLNPIARIAHDLVYAGMLNPADLPSKLYEAINDALHEVGVPVIKISRGGAAEFKIKMSDLPPLSEWGTA